MFLYQHITVIKYKGSYAMHYHSEASATLNNSFTKTQPNTVTRIHQLMSYESTQHSHMNTTH